MLSTTYIAIILLAFLSGITTLIGVALAFYFKKNIKLIVAGLGFSELIPFAINYKNPYYLLLGISFSILIYVCLTLFI